MTRWIERPVHVERVRRLLREHRVVALIGARQVGKSTLARMIAERPRGAELDLLVVRGTRRRGIEFKRADAPRMTPSMRAALTDLRLDSLDVLYPGDATYRIADRVRAVPLQRLLDDVPALDR